LRQASNCSIASSCSEANIRVRFMGLSASQASKHEFGKEEDWPWIWAIRDAEILDWRLSVPQDQHVEFSGRHANLPVEIQPHLFLGDAKCARNMERISALGITHIINAGGPAARGVAADYSSQGITVLEFDAEDEDGYPMLDNHLDNARAFIASAKGSGGKCLVHCVAGINRSGVLVAAEKMLSDRTMVLETVAHCRRCRGNAYLWNHGFQEQLISLARREVLLGPKPGETGSLVMQVPPPLAAHPLTPKPSAKDALSRLA